MRYRVSVEGHQYEVAVVEGQSLRLALQGQTHSVELEPWLGTTHFRVRIDGTSYQATIRRQEATLLVGISEDQYRLQVERKLPVARKAVGAGQGRGHYEIKAPMPGVIVSVDARVGERVELGRPVVIMEAMKMQIEIRAPQEGHVVAVHVQPGQDVPGRAVLVSLRD